MIQCENIEVYGWVAAIRGMRNPLNSWEKSDGDFTDGFYIGPNDMNLARRLIRAGTDHAKFMRMITVTMDITAPLYWWKEYDTYKVGTVANSCSTMHKIHAKPFTMDDFSHEHNLYYGLLQHTIEGLNVCRDQYNTTKDKSWWYSMIQMLPSSYNQRRTVQLNYAVLRSMYFSRRNHKLNEWRDFCDTIRELPYARELITWEGE